jgi:hypothetical protein
MASDMAKLVYLDSSDFSNLSAPEERLSPENREILALLRSKRNNGSVMFFMSAVHLCEAVHAAEAHKPAATRRAALMRELCGANILRLPTEISKLEIQKVLEGQKNYRLSISEITSPPGDWFGVSIPLEDLASKREKLREQIYATFNELPRHERRTINFRAISI